MVHRRIYLQYLQLYSLNLLSLRDFGVGIVVLNLLSLRDFGVGIVVHKVREIRINFEKA
jgi:hypothetical protein